MTVSQPKAGLNNGISIPLLGLGVYNMYDKEVEDAVTEALKIGYRLIDTASMYRNEEEVGNAIRNSDIPRNEIFITTKVNNIDQGYDSTLRAFDTSLKKLHIDYTDLYMVHWPIKGKRKDTWKAMERIYSERRTKAIGVANYVIPLLEEMKSYATIVPAVNQVEFSPYLFLPDLLQYCRQHTIQLQAYSPLVRGKKFKDQRLLDLAKKYGKTPAQIILRWDIQLNVSPIPKSANPLRLKENFDIFDFTLSEADMQLLNSFHEQTRVADDPMNYL